MESFFSHRLIKGVDGDVLYLYVDFSTEFANLFGKIDTEKSSDFESKIQQYIKRYLPDSKISIVYVISGSLLVAALSFPQLMPLGSLQDPIIETISEPQKVVTTNIEQPNNPNTVTPIQSPDISAPLPVNHTYKLGDEGAEVQTLQETLVSLGYQLPVTGVYDEQTAASILNFQKRYPALSANGIYSPKTEAYLDSLSVTSFKIISDLNGTLILVNKTHSLPYDYVPDDLVLPNISSAYRKPMQKEAAIAYEKLYEAAKKDNIDLRMISAYRSYDYQAGLFAEPYKKTGTLSPYRARPGESEHQTGLAVDISGASVGYQLVQSFANTKEGKWLALHAADYGFILRYPKEKEDITGYPYEPWHFRYVGVNSAKEMTSNKQVLEEYLSNKSLI